MSNLVLVTGAAGFAGSYIIELLAAQGADILAWHRPGGRRPYDSPRTVWQEVDLLDFGAVKRAINSARPSRVYHCGGVAHVGRSWNNTAETFAVNVRGTHYLLEALQQASVEARVVIPSSALVYRPSEEFLDEDQPLVPASPYGLSKLAQELLGRRASNGRLSVVVGRAFNHIGPRQDPAFAASSFARQIAEIELGRREPVVVVGNLESRRDTTDVRDTVRAYQLILERGQTGSAYNISSGATVAIGDILDSLKQRATVTVRVSVDETRFRPNDAPTLIGDSSRLRNQLGWTPTIPLSQTLDDLLMYWRQALRKP
jgi:GDP-4-dehydro-6-deoxy-D-mannose reductase